MLSFEKGTAVSTSTQGGHKTFKQMVLEYEQKTVWLRMVLAIVTIVAVGWLVSAYDTLLNQESSIPVSLTVTNVDEGADTNKYNLQTEGDPVIYQMPAHVMTNIQSTPDYVDCIDGLAISLFQTEVNQAFECPEPSIHVVVMPTY